MRSIARLEQDRISTRMLLYSEDDWEDLPPQSASFHFFVQRAPSGDHVLGCQSFYAAKVFKKFLEMKPRSIIITSGTMTPFSEIESELSQEFPLKLVNDHVIAPHQAFMSVLRGGESGQPLNLSHGSWAKNARGVTEDLGQAVVGIVREVRAGGVLVFFQSYEKMHKLLREWEQLGLLDEHMLGKKLFFEDGECFKRKT